MRKNSACFIIFLIAIFFAVPVVSTLLIYEIEVVRDISHSQGTDYSTTSFLADNGKMLIITPDPILHVAQLHTDSGPLGFENWSGTQQDADNLNQHSNIFPGITEALIAIRAAQIQTLNEKHVAKAVPAAADFSVRLPGIGNRPPLIVHFNRTSELPTSATMIFIGTSLIGIAGLRRKKYKKRIRRYRRII